jgi:putative FmdB family regulatory protein
MPTYEYECEKCHGKFEIFQSMKDEHLFTCPKNSCLMETWGEGKVKRLLGTGAGLIFKGSGFYITDYRSSGYKDAAKKDSSSAGSASADSGSAKPSTPAKPSSTSE